MEPIGVLPFLLGLCLHTGRLLTRPYLYHAPPLSKELRQRRDGIQKGGGKKKKKRSGCFGFVVALKPAA